MKKILFAIVAMAGLVAACNMNELVNVNRSADLINFTVTNGGMTKAVDVTTANLTAFEVTAFNHGTETSPYINAVSYTGGSGTFASATPYYWPEGNLDFYAWSQGDATGNQVSKTDYKTFVVTPSATPASQVDLVFAGRTDIGKGASTDGAIALNFRHAESKVVVKVKNTAPNLKFVISDWKLGFIDDAGTFTYSGQGVGYDGSTDGRITDGGSDANALNISMWSGNTDAAASKMYTNTLAENVNIAANASETLLSGEMIVIPQSVTAASAYATASADAAVNGSYVGIKLKILNRENDAVIYDNGAGATAWAIWPADFNFEPGKKYTFTVDLCGGGYYEANHDTDTDLDPILEGAVISFASVTVDEFSAQTAIPVPAERIEGDFDVELTQDVNDLRIDVFGPEDYVGAFFVSYGGNTLPSVDYYDSDYPGGFHITDGRTVFSLGYGFDQYEILGGQTVQLSFMGDEKYAPSTISFTVPESRIDPEFSVTTELDGEVFDIRVDAPMDIDPDETCGIYLSYNGYTIPSLEYDGEYYEYYSNGYGFTDGRINISIFVGTGAYEVPLGSTIQFRYLGDSKYAPKTINIIVPSE